MPARDLLPLVLVLPMLASVVLVIAGRWLPRLALDVLATGCAAAEVALLALLWARTAESRAVSWVGGWTPVEGHSVGVVLAADRIGTGLALLVGVLVLAALVYAWRYFDEPPSGHGGTFPALIMLFEAGMCGFALTGDLFNAFVFFELMGASAYALTGYRVEDPRPLQGALAFALTGSLAGYCTLLGTGLLYARTGELAFARIGAALGERPADLLLVVAFVLVATGMLVKAAAVPFHFWLPDAHAEAPTPVCMLLSGAMVEMGLYGLARLYVTAFSGPGGIPPDSFRTVFVTVGALTAVLGAVMCWQQRHLKRLLAFSTIAHIGLFLVGLAQLTPEATAGTALYVAGHAGIKAALFALAGVLLDRHGSVDEHGLYGRGRDLPLAGALFAAGGLALAGLPPFGSGLGKAVAEHAAGHGALWPVLLFVVVSAVTGGAALRAAGRVFGGAGAPPRSSAAGPETTGDGEEPEVRSPLRGIPPSMLAVPAVLLAAALALGLVPAAGAGLGVGAALFQDPGGYANAVTAGVAAAPAEVPEVRWTVSGLLLGFLSAGLAAALAGAALWGPAVKGGFAHALCGAAVAVTRTVVLPLRRLHAGRVGDYTSWLAMGTALLIAAFAVRP